MANILRLFGNYEGKLMRIAILEDDPSQSELLSHWLMSAGYEVRVFAQGEELLTSLEPNRFDALLVDWNLPGVSGVEVLERVRRGNPWLPAIFCTARSTEGDAVKALRAGADAYLRKPLRKLELLERVQSVLRRGRHFEEPNELTGIEPFRVDLERRTLVLDGSSLDLTVKDFDLAVLFLRNIDRLLPREHIRGLVWGPAAVSSRTLDTHVSRIREKLKLTPEHGWSLAAVYGHGYRLERVEARTLAGQKQPEKSRRQPAMA